MLKGGENEQKGSRKHSRQANSSASGEVEMQQPAKRPTLREEMKAAAMARDRQAQGIGTLKPLPGQPACRCKRSSRSYSRHFRVRATSCGTADFL